MLALYLGINFPFSPEDNYPKWVKHSRRMSKNYKKCWHSILGLIFHYSPEDDNPKWAKHFFQVLACISDSYLRLTTAHTQVLTKWAKHRKR